MLIKRILIPIVFLFASLVSTVQASSPMTLGVVLYDEFELLDVAGPLQMFGNVPKDKLRVVMLAEREGAVQSTQGISLLATHSLENAPKLDLMLVPGGVGARQEINNQNLLTWIEKHAATTDIVMSVCTGAAFLAKTGVLDNRRATSNKLEFKWVQDLSDQVDWVYQARWVDDGKVVTSSGVSAGMDMSLAVIERVFGADVSEYIALISEYSWSRDPTVDPFAVTAFT